MTDQSVERLARYVRAYSGLFVLTGAGCSTDSGIPDYRDRDGRWKHQRPVLYRDFLHSERVRRFYWARSLVGWPRVAAAAPNAAHRALAQLEAAGYVSTLVTQNVDGLHQRAGSRDVVDLHGRLDAVECLDCRRRMPRAVFQQRLLQANPYWQGTNAPSVPDGDAAVSDPALLARFTVPACRSCGGVVKPAVVFFGESVGTTAVAQAFAALDRAPAVLVVGSSLMVYSGYRFCRAARTKGKPVAAINLGRTRADGELTFKLDAACGPALGALLQTLI